MLVEGYPSQGDNIGFDEKFKHLFASAYSYEISGSGYVELDEDETRLLYEQMKIVFEKENSMDKIIKYQLLVSSNAEAINELINKALTEGLSMKECAWKKLYGWELYGNIQITESCGTAPRGNLVTSNTYAQAIVIREGNLKED